VQRQLPPQRGRGQIFRLFEFLEGLPAQTGGASSLQGAMWEYVHQTKRRGLMLILSDLLYSDGYEEGLKLARYHHFDPFVIHILSDDELMPAVRGDARLVDAETQQAVEVSVDGPALEAYARARDAFLGGVEEFCLRHQIDYVRATTTVPFEDLILRYLRFGGLVR